MSKGTGTIRAPAGILAQSLIATAAQQSFSTASWSVGDAG
jgi:hypothetical protein